MKITAKLLIVTFIFCTIFFLVTQIINPNSKNDYESYSDYVLTLSRDGNVLFSAVPDEKITSFLNDENADHFSSHIDWNPFPMSSLRNTSLTISGCDSLDVLELIVYTNTVDTYGIPTDEIASDEICTPETLCSNTVVLNELPSTTNNEFKNTYYGFTAICITNDRNDISLYYPMKNIR